eukprot:3227410-Prymnesium_polylepis.1
MRRGPALCFTNAPQDARLCATMRRIPTETAAKIHRARTSAASRDSKSRDPLKSCRRPSARRMHTGEVHLPPSADWPRCFMSRKYLGGGSGSSLCCITHLRVRYEEPK